MRKILIGMILALVLVMIAGCGSYSNNPATTLASATTLSVTVAGSDNLASAKTYDVEMQGFAFKPDTLAINAGDTVVWTNLDSASHTVESDSGNEIKSDTLPKGGKYSHTFSNKGTYSYHCSIHPSMKGTIVVN